MKQYNNSKIYKTKLVIHRQDMTLLYFMVS